ncbi:protein cueball [Daktulosphaira vitifoliae]|uniref:protein cueball n=1 Tax=Daktulosphaira vitifoliae TaxID=58002 RepID=UPI0021AA8077|nr:protein cueball [Daktulosphaira vitifoliae]
MNVICSFYSFNFCSICIYKYCFCYLNNLNMCHWSYQSSTIVGFIFLVVAVSVKSWDLSVVTQAQIQFLINNEVESTAADQLKDMISAAYDPVTKDIYVSDSNHKSGSIFRIKWTSKEKYSIIQTVVTKQSSPVQGLAFDYQTSTLYWTTGNGLSINHVNIPKNDTQLPINGTILFKFKDEIPQGIAIDSCRGYLYWTNCNHLNATIERSRLDGTDRKVIISDHLFQPLSIAIDVEKNLLYWSDEREGIYYSIESSDENGRSRKVLIHGTHHQPFAVVLDAHNIYWSDWINNAVWSLPKDSFQEGIEPKQIKKYESINTPMGLITPIENLNFVNNTYCSKYKENQVTETSNKTVEPIPKINEKPKHVCKNNGKLLDNGTCICINGFEGKYCELYICDGYCVSGLCSISHYGKPECACPSTSFGDKCEKHKCPSECINGGNCILDTLGNPKCECQLGFTGNTCQYKSDWLIEICSVYCQNTPKSSALNICSCKEYTRNYNYADLAIINSDMSSCKLSKTLTAVIAILVVFAVSLGTLSLVLVRRVRFLGRRPRIKKRIVVNKSITPLTSRPVQQNQQCEITIENCCNMNICETPCFEPDFRVPKHGLLSNKPKKEDKVNLLSHTDLSSEDERPSY